MTNWITTVDVLIAAVESELAAALLTQKHWQQLTCNGTEATREAYSNEQVGTKSSFCALCVRTKSLRMPTTWPVSEPYCVLRDAPCGVSCCIPEWPRARRAFSSWYTKLDSYENFCREAQPLLARIDEAVERAKQRVKKGEVNDRNQ